jgi:hypothetical protein
LSRNRPGSPRSAAPSTPRRSDVATWTEYGVLLADGSVAAAASEQIVRDYVWGRPVFRPVRCTGIPKSGEAVVDVGDWQFCKRQKRAS